MNEDEERRDAEVDEDDECQPLDPDLVKRELDKLDEKELRQLLQKAADEELRGGGDEVSGM